ncbi:MAG TPA: regulatory protein RecX [Rhodanobacteraceae bacterium]|nr:regulatory protein RecX [Rhodanobacteraceae bacterium]
MIRRRSRTEDDAPRRSAYDRALEMLARREHSQRELRTRLDRSGYDEADADAALARLHDQNYQSDTRFAEMLLRNRIAQGYGPRRIRAELATHGMPAATVQALLAAAATDWLALATAQLRRQFGASGCRIAAERARRAQYLLRRGFDASTVRSATHAELDEATDDAD